MATTNFTSLTNEQKKVWSRDLWREARKSSFMYRFAGSSSNAMVHRITELTRTERGDQAVITLVADLEGDGIGGDNTLEGNEEAIKAYDQTITIDQLRNANRLEGRLAEQKSVVRFRETSRDVLQYWLADRLDQIAFLTLSGVSLRYRTDGSDRGAGGTFDNLAFDADVSAPTSNRYFNWDESAGALITANTATIEAGDDPSYAMLVNMRAKAKATGMRPIRGEGGMAVYHVFMRPEALAKLKLDSNFLASVQNAGPRGASNTIFSGGIPTVDGLVIHEYHHVYNTTGLTSGVDKWGSGSNIEGNRVLLCGAQALGFADLGLPYWEEKTFDYGNQHGISIGKLVGFRKPKFTSVWTSQAEDFGVMCVNTAM